MPFWSLAAVLKRVSRLNRRETVKSLLKDLFSGGMIHALGIRAATPDEYFAYGGLNEVCPNISI